MARTPITKRAPDLGRGSTGDPLLEIELWMASRIDAISPLVDLLMKLIKRSRCIAGSESEVELALREALNNAVVHGNAMEAHKLVQVRCRCEFEKGVFIRVSDQGEGFDPNAVPDPLASENLEAEHGRGIHLMKLAMDEVSFERGGGEVHMRKLPGPGGGIRFASEKGPRAEDNHH
jgi:serine/threonine-protein kinase RsbW